MWSFLGNIQYELEKDVFLLLLDEVVYSYQLYLMVDGTVENIC